MWCKNCNAQISPNCIEITLGDTDFDVSIHCYDCDSDYGTTLNNSDLTDI